MNSECPLDPGLPYFPHKFSSRSRSVSLFLGLLVFSLYFAVGTNHKREDRYITYRGSKNRALGNQ
ncbi:MAG: hypothetical protein HGB35_07310 [Geobacteraceae bacterium]|nr:hypothetical protein [Geobacteraceae bacterium]